MVSSSWTVYLLHGKHINPRVFYVRGYIPLRVKVRIQLLVNKIGSSSKTAPSVFCIIKYVSIGLMSDAVCCLTLSSAPFQPLQVNTNQSRAAIPESKETDFILELLLRCTERHRTFTFVSN